MAGPHTAQGGKHRAPQAKTSLRTRLARYPLIHSVMAILAIPLSFFFIEVPYNTDLLQMEPSFVITNLALIAVLFLIVYTLGQRSRIVIAVFSAIFLVMGCANFFVEVFKGQPVTPSDLLALGTAAAVGSGYELFWTKRIAFCLVVYILYCVALFFTPKVKITTRSLIVNLSCCVVVTIGFGFWFNSTNLTKDQDLVLDYWNLDNSYTEYGTTFTMVNLAQFIRGQEPDGYSVDAADDILRSFEDDGIQTLPQTPPTIITVMNESFADLAQFEELKGSEAELDLYRRVEATSLESGTVYISHLGGGTCDCEFEFLTGASLAFTGNTTYPYETFNLQGVSNLASYLDTLGYETTVMHPNLAENWNRNVVYPTFGFEHYYDCSAFDAEAPTIHTHTSDATTYDLILDLLEDNQNPQFLFDITMQNHGGYGNGDIPEQYQVDLTNYDTSIDDMLNRAELEEYLGCIKASEQALYDFTHELDALDRPVVLCFFGDHQPEFGRTFMNHHRESSADGELSIDDIQMSYNTPYLIWANDAYYDMYGIERTSSGGQSSCLNYLGTKLLTYALIPRSCYFNFINASEQLVPSFNMNGFMTPDGSWHEMQDPFTETFTDTFTREDAAEDPLRAAEAMLHDYAIVQYDNLFNKDAARFGFTAPNSSEPS